MTGVLDAACGTGNFLYATLNLLKRLESEVLGLLGDLGEHGRILELEGLTVTPAQFHGLEIKPWAKEIAELVLWIGYLQWQLRATGDGGSVHEPVLRKYGNIECRDAVLASDGTEPVLSADGMPLTRWDGETTKPSPVTGEPIPDETARVPVVRYLNPRKAEWPAADFIVGNPPYIGNKRMRLALGDGYVEALRKAHPEVPEAADLVMYWWNLAATRVRSGETRRFGLITTNSITQTFNRKIVQRHLEATPPLHLAFAVPDHPWVNEADGAAVRVAMTVAASGRGAGTLSTVVREVEGSDGEVVAELRGRTGDIHADLTVGADVGSLKKLQANVSMSFMGVTPLGAGFRLSAAEARACAPSTSRVLRPFLTGRDLCNQALGESIIDFFGLVEEKARTENPELFQRLLNTVYPVRCTDKRAAYRTRWWIFAEPRPSMRAALDGLRRYIATVQVSKHRFFVFVETQVLPDHGLFAVASDDAYYLGVLSSTIHGRWALATSGTLEDRPYWNNSQTFEPFPFPCPTGGVRSRIRDLAEQLDAHRKRQQAQHPDLTLTGIYNVLAKLRSGEALTAKDKVIHEQGLVSILKQLHDDLDAAVLAAYGWPTTLTDEGLLERLVALNIERAEEEKRGLVRWLRPEFQNPGGKASEVQEAFPVGDSTVVLTAAGSEESSPWPKPLSERIVAVRALFQRQPLAAVDAETVTRRLPGARRKDVEAILESLGSLGLILAFDTADGRRWRGTLSA